MPRFDIQSLPDDARVWIFASQQPLAAAESARLLAVVDEHLDSWKAHGVPLHSAREWRDSRFLAVAADERATGASGCSIDGLFRSLQGVEREIGARLVGGGLVFYRDESGTISCVTRDEFSQASAEGSIGPATRVFDTSVTSLGDYRARFETEAGSSWHAGLLQQSAADR